MRNRLKLLITTGVIAASIIVLVILKFTVWSTPTHVDFVKAQTASIAIKMKATALENSYSAYAKELQSGQLTDNSTAQETYHKALADYKTAVSDMSVLKAAKKDAAVHRAYQKFLAKNTKFLNFIEGYVADYPAEAEFNKLGCSSLSFDDQDTLNIAKNYKAFLKKCEPSLHRMARSKDPALSIYGKGMKAYLDKRATPYQNLVDGLANDDGAKVESALVALKAGPDASLTARIQQAHDDALTTNVIANLVTVTTQRANDTK